MDKTLQKSTKQRQYEKKLEKNKHINLCEGCGDNIWKTLAKGSRYQCRACNFIRTIN